ncbi:MAG: hypothetical protein MZV64_17910 [Ignavibacteriales bacterium]|nr:hypothetical protein [Ignavibacteriales bacterium]
MTRTQIPALNRLGQRDGFAPRPRRRLLRAPQTSPSVASRPHPSFRSPRADGYPPASQSSSRPSSIVNQMAARPSRLSRRLSANTSCRKITACPKPSKPARKSMPSQAMIRRRRCIARLCSPPPRCACSTANYGVDSESHTTPHWSRRLKRRGIVRWDDFTFNGRARSKTVETLPRHPRAFRHASTAPAERCQD